MKQNVCVILHEFESNCARFCNCELYCTIEHKLLGFWRERRKDAAPDIFLIANFVDRACGDHVKMTAFKKVALVVAINYKGSQYQLNGCEKDGENMRKFFAGLGYEVVVLSATEAQAISGGGVRSGSVALGGVGSASTFYPTKANIEQWVRKLTALAGLEKFGFFYAGHGTQIADAGSSRQGDEADGMDEALVCQNPAGPSSIPRQCDLFRDDDVIALFHSCLVGKAVEAHVMIDACHSATAFDLGWNLGSGGWKKCANGHCTGENDVYKMVCFSAAQDFECALETAAGGNMTNKALGVIAKGDLSIDAFHRAFSEMCLQAPHISASCPIDKSSKFGVSIVTGPVVRGRSLNREERGSSANNGGVVTLLSLSLKLLKYA